MRDFFQKPFDTRTIMLGHRPMIYIMPKALEKMFHLVSMAGKEVGWFGSVLEDTKANQYYIDDVFLLKQAVGDTTHEIDPNALPDLLGKLTELYGSEKGTETFNRCRFWGHSHVNMKAMPSMQDNIQMNEWKDNGFPSMIRGIFNKHGEIHFSIFYYDRKVVVEDVPWSIFYPITKKCNDELAEEFKTLVTEIKKFKTRKWYLKQMARTKNDPVKFKALTEEFAAFEEQEANEAFARKGSLTQAAAVGEV